jgi:hypothetical protein
VSDQAIADDEVLYRRIPPGNPWFEPPDRISSFNFKLRKGEDGLSVYRAAFVSASGVLEKPGAIAESRVAQATAGQIRAARDSKDDPLHLDVVVVSDEDDPGHAEIRGPVLGRLPTGAPKALQKLFKLVESLPQEP